MKEFRIAKCLDNGVVKEYAIFKDGSRRKRILTNNEYGKYFEVDNELNHDDPTLLSRSFNGRIKDAIDTIRNGNGDVVKSTKGFFGERMDSVVYFIDRKVGEEVRQRSIEGWKDTKFGWVITCGPKKSYLRPINAKGETLSMFDPVSDRATFDTRDEAVSFIEGLIEKAKEYATDLSVKLNGVTDEETIQNIFNDMMDRVEADTNSKFNVIIDFVFDWLTPDHYELKTQDCDFEMCYKIEQTIITGGADE